MSGEEDSKETQSRKPRFGKFLEVKDEDVIPSLAPLKVVPEYRVLGWILFLLLIGLFLVGAIFLVYLRYDARKNPSVNLSTIKDSNLEFPQKISICPEKSDGSVVWHYFDLLSAPNTRIEKDVGISFSSIKYLDYLGFDCLDISIHTKSLSFPAAIEFAVVWTQEFKSYSDILLMLDDKEISSSYVASGLYNSSNGSNNNVDLSLERFTYLPSSPPGIAQRWILNTISTDYYFYEISPSASEIPCTSLNTSMLQYTEGCSKEITTCAGTWDDFRGK
jgi:hypothetical protein